MLTNTPSSIISKNSNTHKVNKQLKYKVIHLKKEKCFIIYNFYLNELHFIIKQNNKDEVPYSCIKILSMDEFIKIIDIEKKSANVKFHLSYIDVLSPPKSYKYFIHYINEYNENLKINILENSTLLSMNMFVNGIYINIYKKVINRKDSNYIENITNNFIRFQSKALDEISKMNEFIYNNYEFMYNLIKFKIMFIYNSIGLARYEINNIIQINVNEINQFYKIMELVKRECTDSTPSGYFNFLNGEKSLSDIRRHIMDKLPINHMGLISKLSCFMKFSNHSILNKQNFEKIKNFELPFENIGITPSTYVSPNKTLFVSDNSKIINFNKKFNYYYNINITGFKKIKFFKHQIIKNNLIIHNNIMKPKVNFNNNTLLNRLSYICSYIKMENNNNIYLYSTRPLTNNFEADINKNINNLLKNIPYFHKIQSQCIHYTFKHVIYVLLNTLKQRITLRTVDIKPQFINISKLNKIQNAIDTINFNYNNKNELLTLLNGILQFSKQPTKIYLTSRITFGGDINYSVLKHFLLKLNKDITLQKLNIEIELLKQTMMPNVIELSQEAIELIEIMILIKRKYDTKFITNMQHSINEILLRAI